MRRLTVFSMVLLFACATVPPPQGQMERGKELRPAVAIYGPDSAIKERRYERLLTQEAFTEVWVTHCGKARSVGNPPLIDFAAFEVIAVFDGEGWNSAGIQVLEMLDAAEVRRVRFDHYSYQTEGPNGGGVPVTPFGLFVLPKTELQVVLEQNVQNMIDEPPVWKERTRW
jgi:hypothetical protein